MWPWSSFNVQTDTQDLTGKVVIVTGGNKGIGYATVKHLARKGAKVYLAARDEGKATRAIETLKEEGISPGEVVWLQLDLSDPRLAKKAAEEFISKEDRLDILVNNAAMLWADFELSPDGVSTIMTVNHISVFQFTKTLLPTLKKTSKQADSDVRIVTVASGGHAMGRAADPKIQFKTLDDFNQEYKEDMFAPFSRYGVSKLANVLFNNALQARLDAEDYPIICMSVHPGGTYTFDDQAHRLPLAFLTKHLLRLFMSTSDVGAYTQVFAAASPTVKANPGKYKGQYMVPVGILGKTGKNGLRKDLADDLWETTERFLGGLGL